ncbi:MAG: aldo/keto reductase [Candidatus Limiplasma sp.]|nr:aldo/keto reductase [Candidatus Limiplasma sp.]MEA5146410.1 aldo/keto reductase [Candidatus Limiplasma sp.]
MKTITLGKSGLTVPAMAVGCMRITGLSATEAERFVQGALDVGANFFDHADVYGNGTCEEIFAKAIHMTPAVREKVFLQSKCGIRRGVAFDFSKEHILTSVDGILKRLNTEYLDVLLLHRPDALVEPQEVAEAFDQLHQSGKVRHFGVSNQNPMQMQLLMRYVRQPFVANQLQLSLTNATMISQGLHVNMLDPVAVNRDGSVLDFCRLNDITVQPWSPFQFGFFEGVFLGSDQYPALNAKIDALAERYGVSNTTIAMAWLLRHPANMQPVTGTMNLQRLKECAQASEIRLTREEWYELYLAAGNDLP